MNSTAPEAGDSLRAPNRFRHHLQDIASIAARLVAESDPAKVHEGILSGAQGLLGAERCALFACRTPDGLPECVASHGLSDEYVSRVGPLIGDAPIVRDITADRDVVVYHDVEADRRVRPLREALSAERIRAIVAVPMMYEDRLIGAVLCYYGEPCRLSSSDRTLARLFATLAAAAAENCRLHAESARRAQRLKVLNETGVTLFRALHRDDLYERVHQQTCRVLPVDSFYIALWNAERGTLSYSLFERERLSDGKFEAPLGDGPSSWVIRHGQPYIVRTPDDPVHLSGYNFGGGPTIHSALHVPLMLGDHVTGVMSAQSYRPDAYTTEDLQMLETLAGQAAVTLENARLYEAVRDASLTDDLTGLPNRRAVMARLNDEVSRAARYGYAISVLLLDLDSFKQVNDTFGHPVGDTVLRELCVLLRGSLRAHDTLGRWGGEEFLAVLVHTDGLGGRVVAENLRRAVESHKFHAGHPPIRLSTSIGGVVLEPPRSVETDRLLDVVDACLYRAKASGRNCVVFQSGCEEMPLRAGALESA